jgi:hypothetical protein
VTVGEGDGLGDGEGDGLGDGDGVTVTVGEGDGDGLGEGEGVGDGVTVGVGVGGGELVTRPRPKRVLVALVVPFVQSISTTCRVFWRAVRVVTTLSVLVDTTFPVSPTYTYCPERSFKTQPSRSQ